MFAKRRKQIMNVRSLNSETKQNIYIHREILKYQDFSHCLRLVPLFFYTDLWLFASSDFVEKPMANQHKSRKRAYSGPSLVRYIIIVLT